VKTAKFAILAELVYLSKNYRYGTDLNPTLDPTFITGSYVTIRTCFNITVCYSLLKFQCSRPEILLFLEIIQKLAYIVISN
jgi:hypothetical protein